jgi:hypothetical protein
VFLIRFANVRESRNAEFNTCVGLHNCLRQRGRIHDEEYTVGRYWNHLGLLGSLIIAFILSPQSAKIKLSYGGFRIMLLCCQAELMSIVPPDCCFER